MAKVPLLLLYRLRIIGPGIHDLIAQLIRRFLMGEIPVPMRLLRKRVDMRLEKDTDGTTRFLECTVDLVDPFTEDCIRYSGLLCCLRNIPKRLGEIAPIFLVFYLNQLPGDFFHHFLFFPFFGSRNETWTEWALMHE